MAILKIKDAEGNIQEIAVIRGERGPQGPQGKTYQITYDDRMHLAQWAADIALTKLPIYNGETGLPLIYFRLQGQECLALEGMTWYEWINSEYFNPIDSDVEFKAQNNVNYVQVIVLDSTEYILGSSGFVRGTDKIIANEHYAFGT